MLHRSPSHSLNREDMFDAEGNLVRPIKVVNQEDQEAISVAMRPLVQQMFMDLDADQSGLLEIDELGVLCVSLGIDLNEAQVQALMTVIDTDGTGAVDFDEFFAWFQEFNCLF